MDDKDEDSENDRTESDSSEPDESMVDDSDNKGLETEVTTYRHKLLWQSNDSVTPIPHSPIVKITALIRVILITV